MVRESFCQTLNHREHRWRGILRSIAGILAQAALAHQAIIVREDGKTLGLFLSVCIFYIAHYIFIQFS